MVTVDARRWQDGECRLITGEFRTRFGAWLALAGVLLFRRRHAHRIVIEVLGG